MKQYGLLCLFVLFIFGSRAQDTTTPPIDWNGDPLLCTVNPNPPSSTRPLPVFGAQAEFRLERVEVKHVLNNTLPSDLTLYHYIYDYNANKLILTRDHNGYTHAEYYYYEILKKSIYYRREICRVEDIEKNVDIDGTSATQLTNGTWHIRPLQEFFLFASTDPRRPQIIPRFIGTDYIRSIPVDIWESCIINKTSFQTVRRLWAFAQRGYQLPTGPVGDLAVPIQANISASVSFPNGTQIVDVDEFYNVHHYRQGITETDVQLTPPKGVFCDSGPGQKLVSLRDSGIEWPNRFSVRVEASTSRSPSWQRFHLRYDRGRGAGSRRIRYDYLPPGSEDYESVIHDFGDNLTYTIDRRIGSCHIRRGVGARNVNPLSNPIGFFIKHEDMFLFNSRDPIWEFNGYRHCRGDSINCAALTSSVDKFPNIVDPDTGHSSGETWSATTMEYGWSVRAPFNRRPADQENHFDYPVYLFLRMYQHGSGSPSPFNVNTEDVEYEFYEMSHEPHPNDFDTSICYRANNYEYLHLGFTLRVSRDHAIDNHVDLRLLEREIHSNLADKMQIRYSRISGVEVYHEEVSNDVNVLFTLLGPTPSPESPTGLSDNEPTAVQSRDTLRKSIDDRSFKFTMTLLNDATIQVDFTSVPKSLQGSKLFMSPHTVGAKVVKEKYTNGAEAGAIIGGLLVGLFVGILVAAAIRIVRKEPMPPMPQMSKSFSNPLPNISFYNKKPTTETTTATASSDA